jgi:UDP:flavonoid glycosyltransferase YjiC (YdhE family)
MRFAFASFGSLGDLHPVLALACEAKARGHEVVVGAATHHQPSVEAAGLEFGLVRPEISMAPELLEYFFDLRRGPSRLLRELVFANARESFEDLWRLGGMADVLVVGECLYGAPMAAEKLGIPWANLILAPTSFLSATDPGVLPQAKFLHRLRWFRSWFHRVVNALGRLQTGWWARPHYQLRRSLGLAAGGNPVFDAKHSPRLTLAMFPEFFAGRQPDWPASTQTCGFPFYEQPREVPENLARFLENGDPPVVFTLGSIVAHFEPEFYHVAAQAAQELGLRAVLLTGNNTRIPRNLPASILAVDYAPLAQILPRAAVVVHAGGIGTCAESLRAGIPSVVMPFSFDQPDNAERLRRLGVAEIADRFRVSNLASPLRRILGNSDAARRARALAVRIDPRSAVSEGVDWLEKLGADKSE